MSKEPKTDSLLEGDFSCETTEHEPTDDELLYPSKHYCYFNDSSKKSNHGTSETDVYIEF